MEHYLGEHTPKLGFGLMRLPKLGGGKIDIEQTKRMVDAFLDAGFTYFDTAYVYDNGDSERAARAALVERHPREAFTLATKLNVRAHDCHSAADAKRQFEASLERTGAGYFDYYLLHAVQAQNIALYDEYGIWDYVRELKAKGKVKHWGFSFHDSPEMLDALLTKHPDAEFVQLQINYADWESPSICSRANYEVVRKHGKSVVIMEPVKGGALANPPEAVQRALRAANPGASLASWAIRFAASLDGVLTVLSGMSNLEQMEDNLSYMRDFRPLDEGERAAVRAAREALNGVKSIPCTGCHYCTEGCPQGIPIPEIFAARNEQLVWGLLERGAGDYAAATASAGRASDCVACGQCESVCPQKIDVIERLKDCAKAFEGKA